jgi:hypothetical protein
MFYPSQFLIYVCITDFNVFYVSFDVVLYFKGEIARKSVQESSHDNDSLQIW